MADRDVTISQLILQVDLLRNQVLGLEQTNARLQRQIGQLQADDQQLKDQITRLTRDSSNSSKPPSSDIVKPENKNRPRGRRKRKTGGQPGHPREERTPFGPDQIDRTIPHELSPARSRGLIPLERWSVLQQVELAEKLYTVTEHRARKYLVPRTGRVVIDRHITQGTRGSCGQRRCQRVWTVLATCCQRNRGVFEFFCNAINAYFKHDQAPSLLR